MIYNHPKLILLIREQRKQLDALQNEVLRLNAKIQVLKTYLNEQHSEDAAVFEETTDLED